MSEIFFILFGNVADTQSFSFYGFLNNCLREAFVPSPVRIVRCLPPIGRRVEVKVKFYLGFQNYPAESPLWSMEVGISSLLCLSTQHHSPLPGRHLASGQRSGSCVFWRTNFFNMREIVTAQSLIYQNLQGFFL